MYLDRRQTGQVGVQQIQPGILIVVIPDVQRDGTFGRARIQRLAADPRVSDRGPV